MSRGNESSDRQVDDLNPPPWRCAVHHLQVPDGDCPKCDDELIALTEQAAEADPTAGERVERCRRLHGLEPGYVMGCDECEAMSARPPEVQEAIGWLAADIAQTMGSTVEEATAAIEAALAAIPAPLAAAGPVDWDSPTWGGRTHQAAWAPDGTHDDITEEE